MSVTSGLAGGRRLGPCMASVIRTTPMPIPPSRVSVRLRLLGLGVLGLPVPDGVLDPLAVEPDDQPELVGAMEVERHHRDEGEARALAVLDGLHRLDRLVEV